MKTTLPLYVLLYLLLISNLPSQLNSFYLTPTINPTINPTLTTTLTTLHAASYYDGPLIDLYRVLFIKRTATQDEVRSAYKKLSRSKHPDRFVSQTAFAPENMTIRDLKAYADENKVGVATVTEKSELIEIATDIYKRTERPPSNLQSLITSITDEFQLINLAYTTLSDTSLRRNYDLTGDWGEDVPYTPPPNVGKNGRPDMGDREEAARVRVRGFKSQMEPLQKKVYERYVKEEREREEREKRGREEAERVQRRKREISEEERKKDLERIFGRGDGITEEEKAKKRQDDIKEQWGKLFGGMFGRKE